MPSRNIFYCRSISFVMFEVNLPHPTMLPHLCVDSCDPMGHLGTGKAHINAAVSCANNSESTCTLSVQISENNFRTLQTIDTSTAKEPFNIIFDERHGQLLPPQTARFCRSLHVKTSFNKVEFDWSTFCERESNATTSTCRRIG